MTMIDNLYHYNAKIISVYDADTVRADIDFGFDHWVHNTSLRLYGINAPELRGDQRAAGIKARDALRDMILDKDVIFKSFRKGKGKYGRYLADIYLGDTYVNKWLVDNGFAVYREY